MSISPDHLRAVALALPDAIESMHMGRPDFRVRGKIFATLSAEQGLAMAKLTPEQQEMLCAAEPSTFGPVPGSWGRRGATHIRLAKVDKKSLASALLMAWRNAAPRRVVRERDGEARTSMADAEGRHAGPRKASPRSKVRIRSARAEEAGPISGLIVRTVKETNSRDYEPAAIASLLAECSSLKVAQRMRERLVYVALIGGKLVGTVSLSSERVNSVFVDPTHQGRGIGTKMMDFIEEIARSQGRETLSLSSSLTALRFYRNRGYEGSERQIKHGVETVFVTKPLVA
jgi:GNAT superfamily N-acetyltransferase